MLQPSVLGNNTIVNCSASEDRCLIEKTILKDDTVTLFKRGCTKAEVCTNTCTDPDATIGDIVCDSCCEEDLCNKGEGPKEARKSGTSRIAVMKGLYAIGGFLAWFLL